MTSAVRLRILIAAGLVVIAVAALYVYNGIPANFTFTFEQCGAWTAQPCRPASPGGVTCHHIALVCKQWRPQVASWVVTWLIESGAVTALAAAVVASYGRRASTPM